MTLQYQLERFAIVLVGQLACVPPAQANPAGNPFQTFTPASVAPGLLQSGRPSAKDVSETREQFSYRSATCRAKISTQVCTSPAPEERNVYSSADLQGF
jgi:hypothetical protein